MYWVNSNSFQFINISSIFKISVCKVNKHNNKTNNKIIRQIRNTTDRKLQKHLTVIESSSHLICPVASSNTICATFFVQHNKSNNTIK